MSDNKHKAWCKALDPECDRPCNCKAQSEVDPATGSVDCVCWNCRGRGGVDSGEDCLSCGVCKGSGRVSGNLPGDTRELLLALHAEFYGASKAHANAFRILPNVVAALEITGAIPNPQNND